MTEQPIKKIGVFDSGLGGLTVLKEILRLRPACDVVYFGDAARVPYGSRARETIVKYAFQDVRFLRSLGVDAIVIACGTVSATALEELRAAYDMPIYGVVEPAAQRAVAETRNGRIGILGTIATVRSGKYESYISACNPSVQTRAVACPLLVPIIENGLAPDDPITRMTCERYLSELYTFGPDTVIMGCTHYPYLTSTFESLMPGVRFINVGQAIASMLSDRIPCGIEDPGKVAFYASGNDASAPWLLSALFGEEHKDEEVHLINIEAF